VYLLNNNVNRVYRTFFSAVVFCLIAANVWGQERTEPDEAKTPSVFMLPLGYDFLRLGGQSVHSLTTGAGFMSGGQDLPFTEVERRFFALALYQPLFFGEEPLPGVPKQFHQIDAVFDGRIRRHQLLLIFKSAADKPATGGLSTFQAGAGWGYEVIRGPRVSLILGGALGVSDFGNALPSGAALPVMPLPLIRFGIDTSWFVSSFEFLTGPNLSFTVAPKKRVRFTADMRMDNYRSISDLVGEWVLWYRFFPAEHKLGDFAGIGAGFKNDSLDFALSHFSPSGEKFELQQSSVFGEIDFTLFKLQGGFIFDSRYLLDGEKTGSPGRGFFLSVQGMMVF
jgi:hypothetical protein